MKLRIAAIAALCVGLVCGVSATGNAQGAAAAKITVLNPMGTPPPIQLKQMAERPASLDGKTIYLVNTGFVGTERLMDVMEEWFKENHPKTTIVSKRNPSMDAADKALWAEIQEKADGVIIGLGH